MMTKRMMMITMRRLLKLRDPELIPKSHSSLNNPFLSLNVKQMTSKHVFWLQVTVSMTCALNENRKTCDKNVLEEKTQ